LVLIDGRRLNNTDLAGPDLSAISLADVERIEIIQGSAGALYGDQAVSGVINIITRRPEKFGGRVALLGGSYNRSGIRGSLHDRFTHGLSYRFSVERIDSDNYRRHNELEFGSVLARIDYDYSGGNVFIEQQSIREKLQTPGALLEAEAEIDRRQSLEEFVNDYDNTD